MAKDISLSTSKADTGREPSGFRRRHGCPNMNARITMQRKASPPTTPPAIAPALILCASSDEAVLAVATGVLEFFAVEGEDTLVEVAAVDDSGRSKLNKYD